MSAGPNHRPDRPLEASPDADLPPLPPEGAPAEAAASAAPAPKSSAVAVLRFLDPSAISATVGLRFRPV